MANAGLRVSRRGLRLPSVLEETPAKFGDTKGVRAMAESRPRQTLAAQHSNVGFWPSPQTLSSHFGTRGRARTGTAFRPRDFKSLVSTIPPRGRVFGPISGLRISLAPQGLENNAQRGRSGGISSPICLPSRPRRPLLTTRARGAQVRCRPLLDPILRRPPEAPARSATDCSQRPPAFASVLHPIARDSST